MHLHPDEQQIVNNYTTAFGLVYPQRSITVMPAGREGVEREARFRVEIDGDVGDRALLLSELVSSQRDFMKGRRHG